MKIDSSFTDSQFIIGEDSNEWVILKKDRNNSYKIFYKGNKKEHNISYIEYFPEKEKIVFTCATEGSRNCLMEIDVVGQICERVNTRYPIQRLDSGLYLYEDEKNKKILLNARSAVWCPEKIDLIGEFDKVFNSEKETVPIDSIEFGERISEDSPNRWLRISLGGIEKMQTVISLESDSLFKLYPFVYSELHEYTYRLAPDSTLLTYTSFAQRLSLRDNIETLRVFYNQQIKKNEKMKKLVLEEYYKK